MDVQVKRLEDWWVVMNGEKPVTTPAGTPVVSHHRELIDEVASDISRRGADPTSQATMYSLQASYLDFGLTVLRPALEENIEAIWPEDIFIQRPPSPEYSMPLRALWGPVAIDRPGFRKELQSLSLRQLMATMQAGNLLRSAVLGVKIAKGQEDLVPLVIGACDLFFTSIGRGINRGAGAINFGGSSGRYGPSDPDEAYCSQTCCSGKMKDRDVFRKRCGFYPVLDTMRRWAAYPEEIEKTG